MKYHTVPDCTILCNRSSSYGILHKDDALQLLYLAREGLVDMKLLNIPAIVQVELKLKHVTRGKSACSPSQAYQCVTLFMKRRPATLFVGPDDAYKSK